MFSVTVITFNLALISDKKFQITQDESDLDVPDPGEALAPSCTAAVCRIPGYLGRSRLASIRIVFLIKKKLAMP